MMIPINLNVKESAYDKVIYFLSHLKDDVMIVNRDFKKVKKSQNSKKISSVDKSIDIISLDKDINSDIF